MACVTTDCFFVLGKAELENTVESSIAFILQHEASSEFVSRGNDFQTMFYGLTHPWPIYCQLEVPWAPFCDDVKISHVKASDTDDAWISAI
jgi:hypothetical protein